MKAKGNEILFSWLKVQSFFESRLFVTTIFKYGSF